MSEETQERSATLNRLDKLVGKWKIELDFSHFDPPFKAETEGSFEWLDADRFFLVYRAGTEENKKAGFPVGYCIIGTDDTNDSYTQLYSDSRGIARIYQMSLTDSEWKQWRDAPNFNQRFTGTFSEDGRTITCTWEIDEGEGWRKDFDGSYTRVD